MGPESGCSERLLKLGAAERSRKVRPRDPGHLLPHTRLSRAKSRRGEEEVTAVEASPSASRLEWAQVEGRRPGGQRAAAGRTGTGRGAAREARALGDGEGAAERWRGGRAEPLLCRGRGDAASDGAEEEEDREAPGTRAEGRSADPAPPGLSCGARGRGRCREGAAALASDRR